MVKNPACVFITTYQQRSACRSIAPYLAKYRMKAEKISLDTFMHTSHVNVQDTEHGFLEVGNCIDTEANSSKGQFIALDNIELFRIVGM